MTDDEDEYNHGFEVFEAGRPRDPSWLNEVTARTRKGEYERAECCADRLTHYAEVPRRRPAGSRFIDLPAARLRLCRHHAQTLIRSDPEAIIHEIGNACD